MIVLDASAVVDYLLGGPGFEQIAERIGGSGETLHAPHVIDLEVAQAVRRLVLSRAISEARGAEALADHASLRIRRHPHVQLLPRVWELRQNASAFDAAYLALAEALDASLLTSDAKLQGIPGHSVIVEVAA